MPSKDFFPQRSGSHPTVYAYSDNNPQYPGLLKASYAKISMNSAFIESVISSTKSNGGDDD
jgi:hypothetical protein